MSIISSKEIVAYRIKVTEDGKEVEKIVCANCLARNYPHIKVTEDMVITEDDLEKDELVFCDECKEVCN